MSAFFIIEGLAALAAIVLVGRYGRGKPVLAMAVIGALGIGFSITWAAAAVSDRHPSAEAWGDAPAALEWNRFALR
jgi:hypothetical protein